MGNKAIYSLTYELYITITLLRLELLQTTGLLAWYFMKETNEWGEPTASY